MKLTLVRLRRIAKSNPGHLSPVTLPSCVHSFTPFFVLQLQREEDDEDDEEELLRD
jgi:hypothetical protein